MSTMSDPDDFTLCKICEQFRDLDRILSWDPPIHHKSWTALRQSAKEGCQLCKAFVHGQAQKHETVKEDFDRDKGFPATQITWKPNTGSGPYILQQPALFVYPHREVINAWFHLYTLQGKVSAFKGWLKHFAAKHGGRADF
jgi:hypothetical protein